MTFDLWWETVGVTNTPETYRGWEASCRESWEAGAKAEREACATVCDQGLHQVHKNGWIDAANERARCAAAIRARSNG